MFIRILFCLLFLAPLPLLAQPADTLLINGRMLTVDENFSTVQALAIRDGRIIATGATATIQTLAGPETRTIDVAGATVVPGLIDNHFHFARAVQRWHLQARLDGVNSRARALDILAAKAAAAPSGQWIMVQGGWFPEQFADQAGGFTLAELDRVAPRNPLFLQERYNLVYANSLALQAVGLDPKDGARRNAAGLATFQPPYGSLIQAIPETSPAQLEQNLTDFMHALNRAGLTALYSLGRGPEGEDAVLEHRAAAGDLPLRIWHTLSYEAADPAGADAAVAAIGAARPNTFTGDYGLFGLGEHIYLPFFDFPSQSRPWPEEVMDNYMKIARAAALGGWHIHEHTMSDISVRDLLDRFEALNRDIPITDLHWTLAHVYDISADSIARAKALGLTLAIHGAAMAGRAAIPFRRIQDSGIGFGLGTDATVVSHYQPFITLGWAVSGKDLAGRQVLQETLSREEALIAHTRANARLFFQEDNLGSLEVGKYADLLVLDRDYMSVPADEIMSIQPALTMVGGRVVYQAEE
ncbi:MAG: amidohydrolase family protein [Pseudomonadales bacterium]|nr:amidohydrolase family protein [Pseudomonadales bacterium]